MPLLYWAYSLVMHTVDSLHYFTSAHIVYVYYNISDIVYIPQCSEPSEAANQFVHNTITT